MSAYSDLTIAAVRLFLNLILFGVPIALGIALAFRLTRVASPRVRYLIALACFFATALLPIVTTFQKSGDSSANSGPSSSAILSKADETDVSGSISTLSTPAQNGTIGLPPAKTTLRDRVNTSVERIGESFLGFWLLTLWITIATLLVGRELIGHVLLRRIRQTWEPARSALRDQLEWPEEFSLLTGDQGWPCTVGFLRPLVVLPAGLSSALSLEDTKRIARHELAHARWRDPLINAVVRIVRAVLWPSLPLWFLERVVRDEREVSADRAAIKTTANSREVTRIIEDYATALVSVAQGCAGRKVPRLYNSAATHIGTVRLEERIHRLFKFSQPLTRTRLMLASVFLLSGVTGVVFLPVTSQGLNAQARANQRRINVARHMATGFANSAAAQQSTSAMNALILALKKRDWQLDGETKSALAQIESSGTIEPLVITLGQDNDWRVREKMAWALGQLNDRHAVEPLIMALRDDAGEVRHTAAWALGIIGDDRAIDALLVNLKDGSFEARQGAAWAVGKIGDKRATEPLFGVLKDDYSDVRHAAVWALGMIGDVRAVGPLRDALNDNDSDVRAQVESALAKVSSR